MNLNLTYTFTLLLSFTINALHAQSDVPRILVEDFYQAGVTVGEDFKKCTGDDKVGNCATIALIKASIAQFGSLNNIYQEIRFNPDSTIHFTFNDGVELDVTVEERRIAGKLGGFGRNRTTRSSIYRDSAIMMYASICKRILLEKLKDKSKCVTNFDKAVRFINSGYNTGNVYKLLGLDSIRVRFADIRNHEAVIAWCSAHAAYINNGTQDCFGHSKEIRSVKRGRRQVYQMRNSVAFDDINGAYILTKAKSTAFINTSPPDLRTNIKN